MGLNTDTKADVPLIRGVQNTHWPREAKLQNNQACSSHSCPPYERAATQLAALTLSGSGTHKKKAKKNVKKTKEQNQLEQRSAKEAESPVMVSVTSRKEGVDASVEAARQPVDTLP